MGEHNKRTYEDICYTGSSEEVIKVYQTFIQVRSNIISA